jgi:hypothetical protein
MLDSTGAEIPGPRSSVVTTSNNAGSFFRFPLAIPVAQGATVYCAVDCFDTNPGSGMYVDHTAVVSPALPGISWVTPPDTSFASATPQNTTAGIFAVYGLGNAVELDGDITLSCVTVGAPAVTAAPSNINVRLDVLPA